MKARIVFFIAIIFLITVVPSTKNVSALNVDKFLVMNDGGCTPTLIATTTGCWSLTSGGAGGAGVPDSTDRALLDGNSGVGSGSINANMNVKDWCSSSACNGGADFGGTISLLTSTITIQRHWNSKGGTTVIGTSTVVFAGSGTLTTKDSIAYGFKDLYNMTINAGVTTTFDTRVGVANILRVNGALVSYLGDSQRLFNVFGVSGTSTPVIRGVAGDLSQSGYFFYSVESSSNFDVVGTVYRHLGVRGAPNLVATMTGDISTTACGNSLDCAMIISSIVPSTKFIFLTNNFDLYINGTFFIGDGNLFPATFHAGSSRIEAHGIDPTGPGISYFETSTLIAHTSPDTCGGAYPLCLTYYQSYNSKAYLQSATLTSSEGEIHLFDTSSFYVNSSSINFAILTVEGHLFKNGLDVSNLQFSVSTGYMTLTSWLNNTRPNIVKWNMSVSSSSGTVTIYMGNMTLGTYVLFKDSSSILTSDANGIGTVAFVFTPGNTAVHTYTIQVDPQQTQIINYGWMLGFVALLTLGLIGAFEIKKRRG